MPILPLRSLPLTSNSTIADAWLERIADRLARPSGDVVADRSALCRDTLAEICFPQYAANFETALADARVDMGTRLALSAMDPRNITLEPEYYSDCEDEKFQLVKPLLWLWYSFDRTVLG